MLEILGFQYIIGSWIASVQCRDPVSYRYKLLLHYCGTAYRYSLGYMPFIRYETVLLMQTVAGWLPVTRKAPNTDTLFSEKD